MYQSILYNACWYTNIWRHVYKNDGMYQIVVLSMSDVYVMYRLVVLSMSSVYLVEVVHILYYNITHHI